jgi:chaperonin GroES
MSELSVVEPVVEVRHRAGEFQDVRERLEEAAPLPMRKTATAFMPLRDQVLVRPCEREEKSESSLIWLPKTGQERPMEGIAIAVGRGRFDLLGRFWPCEVQVGDRVLYGRYAGDEVVVRGEECRLMREEEIKGVIR